MMTYKDVINYLDDHDDESNRNGEVIEFVKFQQQVNKELEADLNRLRSKIENLVDLAKDLDLS